jgi:hypothetical protein
MMAICGKLTAMRSPSEQAQSVSLPVNSSKLVISDAFSLAHGNLCLARSGLYIATAGPKTTSVRVGPKVAISVHQIPEQCFAALVEAGLVFALVFLGSAEREIVCRGLAQLCSPALPSKSEQPYADSAGIPGLFEPWASLLRTSFAPNPLVRHRYGSLDSSWERGSNLSFHPAFILDHTLGSFEHYNNAHLRKSV